MAKKKKRKLIKQGVLRSPSKWGEVSSVTIFRDSLGRWSRPEDRDTAAVRKNKVAKERRAEARRKKKKK